LGHQHTPNSNYSTTQTGRIGASTQSHNSTPKPTLPGLELAHATKNSKTKARGTHRTIHTHVVAENLQEQPASTENRKMQTTLHREDHRHPRSTTTVPLQHHSPPDGVKPPKPDLSKAVTQSPPRKHNARGPRHFRRWTSLLSPRRNTTRGGLATVLHSTFSSPLSPSRW